MTLASGGTPIDLALFAELDPLRLAGSRCGRCGTTIFPVGPSCPRCSSGGSEMATVALPERGTIWTLTVQGFEPKPPYTPPPGGFAPFAVGYVDLGGILVESVLVGDPAVLAIGVEVALTTIPAGANGEFTYAFGPTGGGGQAAPRGTETGR